MAGLRVAIFYTKLRPVSAALFSQPDNRARTAPPPSPPSDHLTNDYVTNAHRGGPAGVASQCRCKSVTDAGPSTLTLGGEPEARHDRPDQAPNRLVTE
jgi:hypothetical protein